MTHSVPYLLVIAGLCAAFLASAEEVAEKSTRDIALREDQAPTQLDPIEVREQFIYPGDASLAKWRRELGCSDCIQVDHSRLPVAVAIAAAVASSLAKGLLPQPRVRGEPNDEALFIALRECWPDDYTCISRYPSTALYNWAPDKNQSLYDDPNAYAK